MHISKIVDNCKSKKNNKTSYSLDEHGITYRNIRDGPNVFHKFMAHHTHTLQPYILYESHNVLGHNGSNRLFNFIRRHHYWKKLGQKCNKYVQSCPECQQDTFKKNPNILTYIYQYQNFPCHLLVWA